MASRVEAGRAGVSGARGRSGPASGGLGLSRQEPGRCRLGPRGPPSLPGKAKDRVLVGFHTSSHETFLDLLH